MGGPEIGVGVASGIAPLRALRASHRLKEMIATAATPIMLKVIQGVAIIEAKRDDMSSVDDPPPILRSRLKLVEVKRSARVTVNRISRVTWTVVYEQQYPFVGTWVVLTLCIVMVPFRRLLASRSLPLS